MADEVALDLEELRHLQSIAKRPRVLSLISSQISDLDKILKEATSAPPLQIPTPISTAPKASPIPALNYVTLGSFSWDQDDDKVKIYIFLEGVEQEKMETEFKPISLDVKFHDVQGKNYRCAIPKLNKEIVPEKCKVIIKPTRVTIILFKASKGNWLDLQFKEDKNMYDEGDEEMKRTIAKAWTDARSGKTADPLKGYR
ncbi:calcyclin-binding protein [Quercus suber]|uniref:Calcyclin-binding protein n=1 Tax=Quercus suber TaxID=58331 RepID=A0AAW0LUW6_QUESU